MAAIRGTGLPTTLGALVTNTDSMAAGSARILPAGELMVSLGLYSYIQVWDSVLSTWKTIPRPSDGFAYCDSDGVNFRLMNLSGCAVGAVVTNAGTAYTSAPTITVSAGGSVWRAVTSSSAHMVNTSATITTAGSGYTYPPRLVIAAPPAGGVPATATCTISSGAVNAVTVVNQGAGYNAAPTCYVFTDPRDTGTSIVSAVITLAVTGAGTIGAVLCTDPGSPTTSVPTLTFAGGGGASAAATVLMNFATTGYTVSSGGSFHAGTLIVSGGGLLTTATSAANTNPNVEKGIITTRQARLTPALSSNAIVASGTTAPLSVEDWGSGFQLIPTAIPIDGTGLTTTVVTTLAFTVGGQTDTVWVQPLRG